MKKLMIVAAIAVLLPVSGWANGLAAYYSYMDTDDFDTGNGGGAKIVLDVLPLFAIDARIARVTFDDLELTPIEGAVSLTMPVGMLRPYAGVGGGYYMLEADAGDSSEEYGWFAMLGLEAELFAPFSLFGEVRWLSLEASVDEVVDGIETISRDYKADGLGVNIGGVLRW